MAVAFSSTPPGMTPPLTVDNDENHSGLITIILSFAMFLVLGSLGIRVYSAYARHARGMDDFFFALIVVVALGQISALFVSVHLGWGQAARLISAKDELKKAVYSADILYVTTLWLSKVSTSVFYRTITMRNSQWMIHGLIGVIAFWGPVSMYTTPFTALYIASKPTDQTNNRILISVRCGNDPWNDIDNHCQVFFPRWQAITALDVVLEMALFLYPIRVIPKLHTSLGKKVVVVLILSCRVILIPVAAVHLYYIHRQVGSSDPTLEGTGATLVAEVHVALSIVVLIAPLMKPFIAAYVDANGLAYTDDASKSLSPHNSRIKAIKGMFYSKGRDPYLWIEDDSLPSRSLGPENHIMKSVQISVDRQTLEIPERSVGRSDGSGVPLNIH
ncbi:uncharacterized protein N7484_010427 [Penicillium longicatenatum]|uniref:uncharacterized protein n=1 Tax=Penicillium longicatenatum TaxID=1561947 RepID=UPI00254877BA|nr:uncharacterized protein N7484_010427 [Penicillium longicatenatum]KAJ5630327.1 hypothetical protein N7484_010427 [Penicillium longicatenatum]